MKQCKGCERTLVLTQFAKRAASEDGLQLRCRDCNREAMKNWREEHPEAHARGVRRRLLRKYGITPEQYDIVLTSQRGGCAICTGTKNLVVDHDHNNDQVRGILCSSCNLALGLLGDRLEFIEAALKYLQENAASDILTW